MVAQHMLLAQSMLGLNPVTGLLNPMMQYSSGISPIMAGIGGQGVGVAGNAATVKGPEALNDTKVESSLNIQQNMLKMQAFMKAQSQAQSQMQKAYLQNQQQLLSLVKMQNKKNRHNTSEDSQPRVAIAKRTRETPMKLQPADTRPSSTNLKSNKRSQPQVAIHPLAPAQAPANIFLESCFWALLIWTEGRD